MTGWRDEIPADLPRADILAAAVGEAQRRHRRRQRRTAAATAVLLVALLLGVVANSDPFHPSPLPLQGTLSEVVTRSSTVTVPGVSHAVAPPRSSPTGHRAPTGTTIPAPPLPAPVGSLNVAGPRETATTSPR